MNQKNNDLNDQQKFSLIRSSLCYALLILVMLTYNHHAIDRSITIGVIAALVAAVIDRMAYGQYFEPTKWRFWKHKDKPLFRKGKTPWQK